MFVGLALIFVFYGDIVACIGLRTEKAQGFQPCAFSYGIENPAIVAGLERGYCR